jgi:hypothetical protein
MTKVLVGGAGGAPSEGVIRSLMLADINVVGMGSDPTDLVLSRANTRYQVPRADHPDYADSLLKVINREKPDLVHFQNDLEIYNASLIRDRILDSGTRLFMPQHSVIDTAVHKFKSWEKFRDAGIKVPENMLLKDASDLRTAFAELGDSNGKIWLRSIDIGGGGKGSLATHDFDFAKSWINHHSGWGHFAAAGLLTSQSITWTSIWFEGSLVVAQARSRQGWTHGDRSVSGVTGVTKVGMTANSSEVDSISISAIKAIDVEPHGIYSVDLTYDVVGTPNPTEINISRFFTTILFFTMAGLNLPELFVRIGMNGRTDLDIKNGARLSPLPQGLIWFRAMDREPFLGDARTISDSVIVP